jgi:hypothetical protein
MGYQAEILANTRRNHVSEKSVMKIFSDQPDYGTQETVIRVLATSDDKIVTKVMLEELPRLMQEAPEWAKSLVGVEVDTRPKLLQMVLSQMPEEVKKALRTLLNDADFQDFYPNSRHITV